MPHIALHCTAAISFNTALHANKYTIHIASVIAELQTE